MLELIWITFLSVLSVLLATVGMGAITEDEAVAQKRAKKSVIAYASRELKEHGLNPHVGADDVNLHDPSESPKYGKDRVAGTFNPYSGESDIYEGINTTEGREVTGHELDHRGLFTKIVAPTKKLRKTLTKEWSDNKKAYREVKEELSKLPENSLGEKLHEDYENRPLVALALKNSKYEANGIKYNPLQVVDFIAKKYEEERKDTSKNPEVWKDELDGFLEEIIDRYRVDNKNKKMLSGTNDINPLLEASAYYTEWLNGREDVYDTLQKYGDTKEEKQKYADAFTVLKSIHRYLTREGSLCDPEVEKIAFSAEDAAKIVKSIPQYVGSVEELSKMVYSEHHERDKEYKMPFEELAQYAKISQKGGTDIKDAFGEYRGATALKHFKNRDVDLK